MYANLAGSLTQLPADFTESAALAVDNTTLSASLTYDFPYSTALCSPITPPCPHMPGRTQPAHLS